MVPAASPATEPAPRAEGTASARGGRWPARARAIALTAALAGLAMAAGPATAAPDLALTLGAMPNPVGQGQPLTLGLDIMNLGPDDAGGATLGLGLPAGVSFMSATPPGSCGFSFGAVICTFPSISSGATVPVTVVVVSSVTGMLVFDASVSTMGDSNPNNNLATVNVTVTTPGTAQAVLQVVKEDGPDPVVKGNSLAYGIAITNLGPAPASAVTLMDVLPTGVDFVSVTPEEQCNVPSEGVVSCNLGTLGVLQTVIVKIVVSTRAATPPQIVNVATADAAESEPVTAMASTTVASSVANSPSAGDTGDPVSTFTGELYSVEAPDLHLGGPLPVFFQRYYGSGLKRDGRLAGRLGDNWLHTHEAVLRRNGTRVEVVTNRGRVIQFELIGSVWTLIGRTDVPFQLAERGAGFVLGDPRTDLLSTFDAAGRLVSVEDGRGNVRTLTYAGDLLTQVSDGLGRTLAFGYDGGGRLIQVSDGSRTVGFGHTGSTLATVTDPLGQVTTYGYDVADPAAARLTATTRPRGNTILTQTYDAAGRVASQIDAEGRTVALAYGAGQTTVTDPLGQTRRHAHSERGELTAVVDELGETVALRYDVAGRRDAATDRLGGTTAYTFHAESGKLASITHADGTVSRFDYTARNLLGIRLFDMTGVTFPDGTRQTLGYDAAGNLTAVTDEAGHTWGYTYNERGQLASATNPLGGVSALFHGADGTLASFTDPAGQTTTFAYDALRRPNRGTHPDGTARAYTYDARDAVISVTDERGQTFTLTYDANGNLASVTDRVGGTTTYAYDGLDRRVGVTDPLGQTATLRYDERGRVQTVTDRNGHSAGLTYDARGNRTAVVDGAGAVWPRRHDAEGVLASMANPLGHTRTFVTDTMGRAVQATGPLGEVSTFAYDTRGQLTQGQDPLGQIITQGYEARGLLSTLTRAGGAITGAYARDALGRITRVTDPNGNLWNRVVDAMGRPVTLTDPLGRATGLQYDARSRVARVDLPGGLGAVDLAFDATGRLTRSTYTDGTEVAYAYDAAGRLTETTGLTLGYDAAHRIVESNGLGIGRDAGGRISSVTLAPGKTVTYAYDSRNLLTGVTDWLGGTTSLAHDAAGRVLTATRPNGVTTTYAHDASGRVVGLTHGALAAIALTRDARGQVTSATRSVPLGPALAPGVTTLTFDAASQVATFTHDAMGRVLADGRRAYTWDLASRLVSYTEAGARVNFTYDGAGNRLTREGDGVTRSYVWNYAFPLPAIAVERQAGVDLRYHVHTPGGILLHTIEAATGRRRFYHYDGAGSTLFLTDDAGQVTDAYAYGPYGEPAGRTGTTENPFTWLGSLGIVEEGATGLYSMRARYYDSAAARFLSRDPVSSLDPRTINPYQYAFGNPLHFADPRGLYAGSRYYSPLIDVDFWNWLTDRSDRDGMDSQTRDDIQAALNAAADLLFEVAETLAERWGLPSLSALGKWGGAVAGGILAYLDEIGNGEAYSTTAGHAVGCVLVGGVETVVGLNPAATLAKIGSTLLDEAFVATKGKDCAPKLFDVFFLNAARFGGTLVSVAEDSYRWGGLDLRAVDRFARQQEQEGSRPAALIAATIGEDVNRLIFGESLEEENNRAIARYRQQAKVSNLIKHLQQQSSGREAPLKFLREFERRFTRGTAR